MSNVLFGKAATCGKCIRKPELAKPFRAKDFLGVLSKSTKIKCLGVIALAAASALLSSLWPVRLAMLYTDISGGSIGSIAQGLYSLTTFGLLYLSAECIAIIRRVSQTGILNLLANLLQQRIADPKLLVMAIMVITSLVAGIFSAGPAAAAMMPVIVELCHGPLSFQSDWIAVAYAASICAGSSLFMWSATAGFILSVV